MGNITVSMQGLYDQFQKEINTLYTREDIINKIEEVKGQEGTSAFASRWGELEIMCEAHGILARDIYSDKEKRAAILEKVPNRKKLKRILLSKLHNMYKEYPMSTHFMERLVRRLAKEFEEDTVRLAILKQFVKYTDYRVGSLENGMKESFTQKELDEYEQMGKAAQREFLLSKLNDEMFDRVLSNSEALDEREWAEFILRKGMESPVKIDDETAAFLRKTVHGEEEITAETAGQLKAIEDGLKEQLSKISYEKKNGGKGTEYDRYRQAKKDKIGAKKDKAKLFRLADELASGKFYTNGKTRESLYLFALAFGMTACIDEDNDVYYEETDFEKNLLFDYYNDNLLRYVLDKEYCLNSADYEAEPVGEGINYKNYVEIIYLYYIYRRDLKLTPAERIKKAQRLINKCASMAKKMDDRLTEPKKNLTKTYKKNYIKDVLTLNKESEIADYICKNYYIVPPEKEASKPKMLLASEQYTVRGHHKKLLDNLEAATKKMEGDIGTDYEFGMDINFILAECEKWKRENTVLDEEDRKFLELVEQFDDDFKKLMTKLGEKLRTRQKGLLKKNRSTGYTDKTFFTRSELITVCSCCFQYDMDDMAIYSVPELFDEFCQTVNPHLEECRYQKISVKNIYDMFVFFSLILGAIY